MEHLAAVPMFRACSSKELLLVSSLVEDVHIEPGTMLAREGRIENELFVIVEGTAQITRAGKKVATLGPGDYFGELGLLDPARRNATVTATTPMEVLVISRRELYGLLQQVPGVALSLLTGMARRLHQADSVDPTRPKKLTPVKKSAAPRKKVASKR